MKRTVILIMCIIAICIQHIIHEYAHVLTAKIFGEKVLKVQWLTYHGGTRVFYENEPDYTKPIAKKWAVIAAGGYIATNVIGYCLILPSHMMPIYYLRYFCYIASMMFLFIDSFYFVIGSIGDFGDIIGVRETLGMPKWISVVISICVMLSNIAIIKIAFY